MKLLTIWSLMMALSVSAQAPAPATVFIYRSRFFEGSGARITLSLDGEPLAYLQNGRFLTARIPPGKHILSDKKPDTNIDLIVESGRAYYVRCEFVHSGLGRDYVRFSMSDEATGKADIRRLKPGDPDQVKNRVLIP